MQMTTKKAMRVSTLAGVLILGTMAGAATKAQEISIDRALNSPTITIHYTKANAALVELRVNGESLGTRAMNAAKSTGDTNFTINLTDLKEGDNEVEVRLFDRTGRIIGSDKTNISTESTDRGPIFLSTPKIGSTVKGPVEINLGFGHPLKKVYVSFFVDSNLKASTNYPPFNYLWDTERETNGWHEIEAWAIDDSNTFKTKKLRVFVNNPGGRTDRKGVDVEISPSKNPLHSNTVGGSKGLRTVGEGNGISVDHPKALSTPAMSGPTISNMVKATLGTASGLKPVTPGNAVATGMKNLTPTGNRNATVKMASQLPNVRVIKSVATAASLLTITKGQRIPNVGSFVVVLDSQYVRFDIQPRTDDGVPMTPFRYLLEKAGGKVDWTNMTKTVSAKADGKAISLQIGEKDAIIDNLKVSLEIAPYLDRGRTIVPLSFIREALNVNIEYDKATNHVLITSIKK